MKTGIGKEVKKLSKKRDNPSVSAAAACCGSVAGIVIGVEPNHICAPSPEIPSC